MTSETTQSVPLFVDLDGTLIKTDLLAESALVLLKQAPWMIFVMPLWLLRGKAYLKARIAEHVSLATDTLPLQTAFVAFLQSQQATGRPLYLATAADARLAQPMADRLGIFRGVLASDGIHNLRSKNKLAAIAHITGGGCFDYAGNARADFPIWPKRAKPLWSIRVWASCMARVCAQPSARFLKTGPRCGVFG